MMYTQNKALGQSVHKLMQKRKANKPGKTKSAKIVFDLKEGKSRYRENKERT